MRWGCSCRKGVCFTGVISILLAFVADILSFVRTAEIFEEGDEGVFGGFFRGTVEGVWKGVEEGGECSAEGCFCSGADVGGVVEGEECDAEDANCCDANHEEETGVE